MKVTIDGAEYVEKKEKRNDKPMNQVGATHYAILPDDSYIFYKIADGLSFMYMPFSKAWESTNFVPYDLKCFDE